MHFAEEYVAIVPIASNTAPTSAAYGLYIACFLPAFGRNMATLARFVKV
jgi:hypothetical protein